MFNFKKIGYSFFILLVLGWVYFFIAVTLPAKTLVEIIFRLGFAAILILLAFFQPGGGRPMILGLLAVFIISWLSLLVSHLDFQVSIATIKTALIFTLLVVAWLNVLIWQRLKNVVYTYIEKRIGPSVNRVLVSLYLLLLIGGLVYLINNSYKLSLFTWLSAGILLISFYLFNRMYQPLGKNIAIIKKRDKPVLIKKGDLSLVLGIMDFSPLNSKSFKVKLEITTPQGEKISSVLFVIDSQSAHESTYHYDYDQSRFFGLKFQLFGAKKKALLCELV